LLHCVSSYPVPDDCQNLRAITALAERFHVVTGLSDHSTDPLAIVMAVALGASVYEKHFMLPGQHAIDQAVSAEPAAFAALVRAAEHARLALGDGRKQCLDAEAANVMASRRSIYAARDLHAGDVVTSDAIVLLRPGSGLEPRFAHALIGSCLTRDVPTGSPFVHGDLPTAAGGRNNHVA
jgi:N,N'-diacetyllegionaminate synthase